MRCLRTRRQLAGRGGIDARLCLQLRIGRQCRADGHRLEHWVVTGALGPELLGPPPTPSQVPQDHLYMHVVQDHNIVARVEHLSCHIMVRRFRVQASLRLHLHMRTLLPSAPAASTVSSEETARLSRRWASVWKRMLEQGWRPLRASKIKICGR